MKQLTNAQKTELTFEINTFQKPLELTKFQAWAQEIIILLLAEPGTFPSMPEAGIGLNRELYESTDYWNTTVVPKIESQVEEYLSEIPFDSASFEEVEGMDGVVLLTLNFNDTSNAVTSVKVAMQSDGSRIRYSDYFIS